MKKALRPALLVAAALALAAPAGAAASRTQESLFQDDAYLLGRDLGTQTALLNEVQALGVDTIHAIVLWPRYVPGNPSSARKPRGNPASPSYYPAEKWDLLDNLVRETDRRGMSLILSPAASAAGGPTLRVPRWARRGKTPKTGEYANFVAALGRRYNGGYTDENQGGGKLPKVSRWRPGNEPNQGGWIQPQFKRVSGKLVPYSPVIYRDLYNAARRLLLATGHRGSDIYLAGTAPTGVEHKRRNARSAMSPGLFLRELVCVDTGLRRYRGGEARRRKCVGFRKIRTTDLAHHFYTEGKTKGRTQLATYRPPAVLRDSHFPIGNLKPLESLLRKLGAKGLLPRGLQIVNTEFGFQSSPPDTVSGVSLDQQAEQENVTEYIAYKDAHVLAFEHYLMYDDVTQGPRLGGFQTGLRFIDGRPKPAHDAFAMPIVAIAAGGGVKVWGAARASGQGAQVQVLADGAVVQTVAVDNVRGYFETPVLSSPATATYQLLDLGTGARSRLAKVSPGVK